MTGTKFVRKMSHYSARSSTRRISLADSVFTAAQHETFSLYIFHLDFPRVNLSTYGKRAFAYAGPTSWNSLPDNVKNINLSLQTFKRHLKTFFFSSY